MSDEVTTLLVVALVAFFLAGLVKGVMGMGLPTIAMGLLSIIVPPVQAAAVVVVPGFATNVWQALAGPALGRVVRRLAPMLVAVWIGIFSTVGMLTGGNVAGATASLGLVLAAYGLLGLRARRPVVVPRATERWMSPVIGFATGAIMGATGIFVIPAVPYLNSLGMEREELIQALGLSFTAGSLGLGIALVTGDAFGMTHVGTSVIAVVPAMIGMYLGQRVRTKLPPATFRRWFFIGVALLGLYMLGRSGWMLLQ